jgi:hypothetical protein
MKDQYNELREDIQEEEKAIEDTLMRLLQVRGMFDPQARDYSIEPAMGTYLMNFYNGIENILKRVSKEYYQAMPKGESWHKELLITSSNPPRGKVPLLSQRTMERLSAYRNFRHRFVSGYGFQLKGEKMLELIDNVRTLWNETRQEISEFWDKI